MEQTRKKKYDSASFLLTRSIRESNKLIAIIEELLYPAGRKSVAESPWQIGPGWPAPSGLGENRRIKYPACFHGTLP